MAEEAVDPVRPVRWSPVMRPVRFMARWAKRIAGNRAAQRLGRWLLYGVVIGLLPLFLNALREMAAGKGDFTATQALSNGELYLISGVLVAGAMGEKAKERSGWTTFGRALALICLTVSTAFYTYASFLPASVSVWVFAVTVVAGGILVAVGDGDG